MESDAPRSRDSGWRPGQSGNPAGRPKGSRNAALVALDLIGQEGAEKALKAVVEAATGGDMRAAEILLRRVWPERKGRPVSLALPRINKPADLVTALAAVADAVATGELSPEEGQAVAAVLEAQRRATETADLAARVEALEQRSAKA